MNTVFRLTALLALPVLVMGACSSNDAQTDTTGTDTASRTPTSPTGGGTDGDTIQDADTERPPISTEGGDDTVTTGADTGETPSDTGANVDTLDSAVNTATTDTADTTVDTVPTTDTGDTPVDTVPTTDTGDTPVDTGSSVDTNQDSATNANTDTETETETPLGVPVFEGDWSRIRRYGHGQNRYLFSEEELAYIDSHIAYLTVEKIHGSSVYEGGNLDQAAMQTAEDLKNTKVLLYLQSFYAFERWQAVVNADFTDTELFVPDNGQAPYAFNQGTPEGRAFWAAISDDVVNNSKVVGTYVDAIGKIITHGHSDWLPEFKQTLSQLDGLTIYNGPPGEFLDYTEGFMMEDFMKGTGSEIAERLDLIRQVPDEKYRMLNSFHPDYQFALAGFLIVANDRSFFRYFPLAADGSNHSRRWADVLWHCEEYDKPLGAPLGDAVKNGLVYTRVFRHATVTLDLENETSSIEWGQDNR